jgi:acetyl esterase
MSSQPFADQQLADFMRSLAEAPPMAGDDVAAMRRGRDELAAQKPLGPAMPTSDLDIGDDFPLPCRLYRPADALEALVIYFHGGGWTIGSLTTHDRACRRLADRAGVAVLAVDYRLAPEHPAPAAIDDAVTALKNAPQAVATLGVRPKAIAVAGDSSGGNLAALAALRTRHRDVAPDLAVLIYANTNLAAQGGSMVSNAGGFGLDAEGISWFNEQWVPDRSRWSDPEVSPLLEKDLSGLPETIIVTCELDPLRDQGEEFAARLAEAGVPVSLRREPGMVHNFMLWDLVSPSCAAAADRVAEDIHRAIKRIFGAAAASA